MRLQSLAAVCVVVVMTAGCAPRQRQITCPTARVTCPCAELEREEPVEEVAELIASLRAMDDDRLQVPSRAAEALAARCRDAEGPLPPVGERRDADWRVQCSAAEVALPALLETLTALESRRDAEGRDGESSSEESSLATRVVSALGNLVLGNPESPCRGDVARSLIAVVETPEPAQDLAVNDLALRMLGAMGESEAAPAITAAMFMRSRQRALSLQEPARAALMELDDHRAVAEALVRAGRLEDEALARLVGEDSRIDARLVKEQVALTLGLLGLATPEVVEYLMAELRHTQLDEVDRSPNRDGESVTPEQAAAWRRSYAAVALGRLRHQPALDVILGRLTLDTNEGRLVDPTVNILEVPGYLETLGRFVMPARTDAVLVDWMVYGLDINRDRAGRWLSLQGSASQLERLEAVTQALRPCSPGGGRCIRRNFEERYLPALRASSGCSSLACWQGRLTEAGTPVAVRERAIFQIALLASSVAEAERAGAREALLEVLLREGGDDLDEAAIFAMDRISPAGCDGECQGMIEAVLDERRAESSFSGELRRIRGLLGRLRYRATTGAR